MITTICVTAFLALIVIKSSKPDYAGDCPEVHPCIVRLDGKYWNGQRFTKNKKVARRFNDPAEAWAFIDAQFSEAVAEDCEVLAA